MTTLVRRSRLLFGALLVVVGSSNVGVAQANPEIPGSCSVPVPKPGCVPALQGAVRSVLGPDSTLPNLSPAIPYVVVTVWPEIDEQGNTVPGPRFLEFTTAAKNVGSVPVELLFDPQGDPLTPPVRQCVSWTERVCRAHEPVGGFSWHTEHQHFHFEEFARYELRRLDAAGGVDRSPGGLIAESPKVSFCLMDSAPNDEFSPSQFYVTCAGVLQGISPGWADVYEYYLAGQSFSIDDVPDGTYAVTMTIDPFGRLYETDRSDNSTTIIVEIFEGGTQARIVSSA